MGWCRPGGVAAHSVCVVCGSDSCCSLSGRGRAAWRFARWAVAGGFPRPPRPGAAAAGGRLGGRAMMGAAGFWRRARFSRNAQQPCASLPAAASRRSGWVAVASAGRMAGSGSAMAVRAEAVGVFSRNAQRPCESLRGAASRRTGGVAVASTGPDWRLGVRHGGEGGGGGRFFAKRATTLRRSARGCVPAVGMDRGGIGGADGRLGAGHGAGWRRWAFFREMRNDPARVCQGLHPGGRDGSWWHRRERMAGSGSAMVRGGGGGRFFAKRATTLREPARGCVPAVGRGRGGIGGVGWPARGGPWWGGVAVAGVFSRNAQRPCDGLPGAVCPGGRDGSAVASWRERMAGSGLAMVRGWRRWWAFFSRNAQRPSVEGLRGAVSRRSGWIAVASAGRMAGSGSAMVVRAEAVGVFSRNAQRPCAGPRPGGRDGSWWHRRGGWPARGRPWR